MARQGEIEVLGMRELNRAFGNIDKKLKRKLTKQLEAAGNIVRDDVREYWSGRRYPNQKSIMGFRTSVRMGAVAVRQRYSPGPTGTRGDFGAREMASMAFGLKKVSPLVEVELERVLDRLASEEGF